MVLRLLSLLLVGIGLLTATACTPAQTPPAPATPPRAATEIPQTFASVYGQGRALMLQKQYAEALGPLTASLALAPREEHPLVLTDIGYCHLQLRQFTAALDDCQKALVLDAGYHYGYYLRASVYAQINAFDKSIADLEHCLVLKPEDPTTLKLLGYIYFLKSDFATALSVFDGLAQAKQDSVYVHNFRAKLFRKLGRDDDASAALELVLAEDPTFADAYYLMGLICEDHKSNSDAMEAYAFFLKYANPQDPDNTEGIRDVKQRLRKLRFKQILTLQ